MNVYFKRMLEAYSAGEMSKVDEIAKEFVQSFKAQKNIEEESTGVTYSLVINGEPEDSDTNSFEEAIEWAKEAALEPEIELYKVNYPVIYIVEIINGVKSKAWKFNYTVDNSASDSDTQEITIEKFSVDPVELSDIEG